MRKPRIFIGSSVESLPIADAVGENLEFDAEVTIWRSGTFKLSNNALDDLILKSKSVDFSIFIFSPDDVATIRSREAPTVRDNVVFELGLFIGSIGKERCFIVKPRNTDLHFPSDLLGITPTDYDSNRSDDDLTSSLTYAATQIKREMKDKGIYEEIKTSKVHKIDINDALSEIADSDLYILGTLLESYNNDVEGYTINILVEYLRRWVTGLRLNLAIVKLERIGLIEKKNSSDMNGNEFFTFSLSDYGVDVCLKNENKIAELFEFSSQYGPYRSPQQAPKF